MKRLIYSVILGLAVVASAAFAMSCGADTSGDGHEGHGQMQQTGMAAKSEAVDSGNKICPVSGEEIDEAQKATYEYEGRIYNFCCSMCIDEFKKEPEKYIKKIDEELKAESKTSDDMQSGHNHGH